MIKNFLSILILSSLIITCSTELLGKQKNHYKIPAAEYIEIDYVKLFFNIDIENINKSKENGIDSRIYNLDNSFTLKRVIKFSFDLETINNNVFWISGHPSKLKIFVNNQLAYHAEKNLNKLKRIRTKLIDIPQKFLKKQNNIVLITIEDVDQYTIIDFLYFGNRYKIFFKYMLYFILLGSAITLGFVIFCIIFILYYRLNLKNSDYLLYVSIFLLSGSFIFISRSSILLYLVDFKFTTELFLLQYIYFSDVILIYFITNFLKIKKSFIIYINKTFLYVGIFSIIVYIFESIFKTNADITFSYLLPFIFTLRIVQIIYSVILFVLFNNRENIKKIEFKLILILYIVVMQDLCGILGVYKAPYFIIPRDADYLLAVPLTIILVFKISKLLIAEYFSSQEKVLLIEANKIFNVLSGNDKKYLYFYYKYCSKKKYAYRMAKKLDVTPDSVNRQLQRIKRKLQLTEISDLKKYKDLYYRWHNSQQINNNLKQ